jgi:hypothetical protein
VTADEAVVAVIDALERSGIPFMIVGSLASNFHGIPRSTRDADFVVELPAGSVERLRGALPSELALQSQGGFETVTGTTRYLIEMSRSPFVAELFVLSDDAHDRSRFERRQLVSVSGRRVHVATAEDMVVTKLRWAGAANRGKDRDDIRNMLAVRGPELDWDYIGRWTREHGTTALLTEIRESIPSSGDDRERP